MGCNCGSKGKVTRQTFVVKLPGGLEVKKTSEAAAKAFAASHPGSKVLPQKS